MQTPVLGLYVGRPKSLPDGRRSAIVKAAVSGPLRLGETGLDGDKVADARVHGGPEMALHQFPAEHYAEWRAQFPEIAAQLIPGSIGENLSTEGFSEDTICIGDVFRWGEAEIEVSQPRMPCVKINSRYQIEGLSEAIMAAGRCGWYYRVRRPGLVAAGQTLQLIERKDEAASLAQFWAVQNAHRPALAALQAFAEAPGLAPKWQARFAQRLLWRRNNGG